VSRERDPLVEYPPPPGGRFCLIDPANAEELIRLEIMLHGEVEFETRHGAVKLYTGEGS
jgi:hypothetical protein